MSNVTLANLNQELSSSATAKELEVDQLKQDCESRDGEIERLTSLDQQRVDIIARLNLRIGQLNATIDLKNADIFAWKGYERALYVQVACPKWMKGTGKGCDGTCNGLMHPGRLASEVRNQTPCDHYLTATGCRRGYACAFLHPNDY